MRWSFALLAVLLLGAAACGTDAPAIPRNRRIAQITRQEGNPPIETIWTPLYDGDQLVSVHKSDQFVDADTLVASYEGDQLVRLSDGKNVIRYSWQDGRPTRQVFNDTAIDYVFEDDLIQTASHEGEELGRYHYENSKLVVLDFATRADVHFAYDDHALLRGVEGGRYPAAYDYDGVQVTQVRMHTEVWDITYQHGLISTIERAGLRTPLRMTYTYDDGEMIGLHAVPPIPQAAIFGIDGMTLPTVELLSVDLTGNALSAFGAY